MTVQPYSATVLAFGGAILMILGFYFVLLQPPLLPKDPRFIGTSMAQVQVSVPGLLIWLRRLFWALGGYMCATGLLTFYVALTFFQVRVRDTGGVVAISGLTSIGLMAAVTLMIASDFR
jgi:hypothetical protein